MNNDTFEAVPEKVLREWSWELRVAQVTGAAYRYFTSPGHTLYLMESDIQSHKDFDHLLPNVSV